MKTLTIKLNGPLQSYGNEAHFNYRTSYPAPSKSAILGMIAAAKGYQRDDPRMVQLNQLAFATRIDQPGHLMTDFHIVHYQKGNQIKSKITHRDYLQDAVFIAAIGGPNQEIDQINYDLHHPAYALYLGRRCNPLAGALQTQLFDDQNPVTVLKNYPWQARPWFKKQYQHQQKQYFKLLKKGHQGITYHAAILADADLLPKNGEAPQMVKDAIGSFNPEHRYSAYRPVVKTVVQFKLGTSQNHHDPQIIPVEFFEAVK